MDIFSSNKNRCNKKLLETKSLVLKSDQIDGGGEFKALAYYFVQYGIEHRITRPHTSWQNEIVERKNSHIVEMGLTLIYQDSLPMVYWSNSFHTTIFLINKQSNGVLSYISPHGKLLVEPPDYSFVYVFSSLCFPFIRPFNKQKLYYSGLDVDGWTYVPRHVHFYENVFPFVDKHGQFIPPMTSKNTCTNSHFFIPFSFQNNSSYSRIISLSCPARFSFDTSTTSSSSGTADHSSPCSYTYFTSCFRWTFPCVMC